MTRAKNILHIFVLCLVGLTAIVFSWFLIQEQNFRKERYTTNPNKFTNIAIYSSPNKEFYDINIAEVVYNNCHYLVVNHGTAMHMNNCLNHEKQEENYAPDIFEKINDFLKNSLDFSSIME